jgi:hypothetical protein
VRIPVIIQTYNCLEQARRLHALRDVTFGWGVKNVALFLEKHGTKIRELRLDSCSGIPIFNVCPAMSFLRVDELVSI